MQHLVVFPQNMERNMNIYGGVIFSQRVLLALIDAGVSREMAYRLVQRNAHAAWNVEGGHFRQNIVEDPDVLAVLSADSIEACFDPSPLLQHIDVMFARFPKPVLV
jgi:adenylosuccinate lyase